MKRIRLIVAYDGTNYSGWQKQDNALAIEQLLNETLSKLLNEEIEVIGASRTDAGVHALANVAVFDTNSKIPADKFSYMLNQWLPKDVRIRKSDEVDPDWHPRAVESDKTYEYKIFNARHEIPLLMKDSYFVYLKMDMEKMRQGAKYLEGEHDFTSFASRGGSAKSTVRSINSIEIKEETVDDLNEQERLIRIRINGNGFLYNMVRIIVGTLVQVATGLRKPEDIVKILEEKDRDAAGPTAPAKGLTLIKLNYHD